MIMIIILIGESQFSSEIKKSKYSNVYDNDYDYDYVQKKTTEIRILIC